MATRRCREGFLLGPRPGPAWAPQGRSWPCDMLIGMEWTELGHVKGRKAQKIATGCHGDGYGSKDTG